MKLALFCAMVFLYKRILDSYNLPKKCHVISKINASCLLRKQLNSREFMHVISPAADSRRVARDISKQETCRINFAYSCFLPKLSINC